MLKTPLILVNFKTYLEATGKKAVLLAKICEKVAKKYKIEIAIAVQAADIAAISKKSRIPVLAEHVDFAEPGAHTGSILPEAVKEAGANGALINHSEHQIPLVEIQKTVARAKSAGLTAVVCADVPQKARDVARFAPDFIAIEPPELIGGNVSVSTAKPEVITQTLDEVSKINKDIPVLCGAGVKTKEDVAIAVKLGAKGILVASGVTKSMDPEEVLIDFCNGIKEGLK